MEMQDRGSKQQDPEAHDGLGGVSSHDGDVSNMKRETPLKNQPSARNNSYQQSPAAKNEDKNKSKNRKLVAAVTVLSLLLLGSLAGHVAFLVLYVFPDQTVDNCKCAPCPQIAVSPPTVPTTSAELIFTRDVTAGSTKTPASTSTAKVTAKSSTKTLPPTTTPKPTTLTTTTQTTSTSASRRTTPQSSAVCTSAADIVFVVDSSGSIRDTNPPDGSYDNWAILLDFISSMVGLMEIGEQGTQVGLVIYSGLSNNNFYLNSYYDKTKLQNVIKKAGYIGSYTNTSGALRDMQNVQFTAKHGDRSNVPNIAFVITDGVSNHDHDKTIPDAEAARAKGITIYSLGISNKVDQNELKQMSSMPQEPNKQWFTSPDFRQLSNIMDSIIRQSCK